MANNLLNFDIEAEPKRITAILNAQETQVINKRSNGNNGSIHKANRAKDNNRRKATKRPQSNN